VDADKSRLAGQVAGHTGAILELNRDTCWSARLRVRSLRVSKGEVIKRDSFSVLRGILRNGLSLTVGVLTPALTTWLAAAFMRLARQAY